MARWRFDVEEELIRVFPLVAEDVGLVKENTGTKGLGALLTLVRNSVGWEGGPMGVGSHDRYLATDSLPSSVLYSTTDW